jgi:hypothetical protein
MAQINGLNEKQQVQEILLNKGSKLQHTWGDVISVLYVIYKDIEKIKKHLEIE